MKRSTNADVVKKKKNNKNRGRGNKESSQTCGPPRRLCRAPEGTRPKTAAANARAARAVRVASTLRSAVVVGAAVVNDRIVTVVRGALATRTTETTTMTTTMTTVAEAEAETEAVVTAVAAMHVRGAGGIAVEAEAKAEAEAVREKTSAIVVEDGRSAIHAAASATDGRLRSLERQCHGTLQSARILGRRMQGNRGHDATVCRPAVTTTEEKEREENEEERLLLSLLLLLLCRRRHCRRSLPLQTSTPKRAVRCVLKRCSRPSAAITARALLL